MMHTSEIPTAERKGFKEFDKTELLEDVEDSADEILERYGGIALGTVFPEMTLDPNVRGVFMTGDKVKFSANGTTKEVFSDRLSYHMAFPGGIVVTPETQTFYIPEDEGLCPPEYVKVLMEARSADIQKSLTQERKWSVSAPFATTRSRRHDIRLKIQGADLWDDLSLRQPQKEPSQSHLKSDPKWVPSTAFAASAFQFLTPEQTPNPDDVYGEAEFRIQSLKPEETTEIMKEPQHTLVLTYYYQTRRALGIEDMQPRQAAEEFLKRYRPVILSPSLVILKENKEHTDPETGESLEKHVILARGGHFWHKNDFIHSPDGDISISVNRWLHSMEQSGIYNGPKTERIENDNGN